MKYIDADKPIAEIEICPLKVAQQEQPEENIAETGNLFE